jgi:hypothetical protein
VEPPEREFMSDNLYAWFFRDVPSGVPVERCVTRAGATLLYVGIAPRREPKDGKAKTQSLRRRIRTHLKGDASRSTLRLSLGCLLAGDLGIELQAVGGRIHFGAGESSLSTWLEGNALVGWVPSLAPWDIESGVIGSARLPLNLEHNDAEPFASSLSVLRRSKRAEADGEKKTM